MIFKCELSIGSFYFVRGGGGGEVEGGMRSCCKEARGVVVAMVMRIVMMRVQKCIVGNEHYSQYQEHVKFRVGEAIH